MSSSMGIDDKVCKSLIFGRINSIANNAENVESAENWFCQLNILREWYGAIVSSANGICSRNNSTSSVKSCHNSSLADGNSLLFHSLMNRCSILIIHLVKLVD